MKKNEMIAEVARETAKAWYEMAFTCYVHCPRVSLEKMFSYQENDARICQLRAVWYYLNELREKFDNGYSDEITETYYERAEKYSRDLFRECKAVEQ